MARIQRFIGAAGPGVGDVLVTVFPHESQIFSDEVLKAGPSLVREIELGSHGWQIQVGVDDSTAGKSIGKPRAERGELPTPEKIRTCHYRSFWVDNQMEREFHKEFMASLVPGTRADFIGKKPAEPADEVNGLHLGPSVAKTAMSDAVPGEHGPFVGGGGIRR